MGHRRRRRRHDPRFRHHDERQPRRDGKFQDQDRRVGATRSTSTGSATTTATARGDRARACPQRRLPQDSADCADRPVDRRSSTAAPGRCPRMDGPDDRRVGRLHRQADPDRHRRRRATSRSSSATTPATRTCLFKTSDATWQAYNAYGGADFYTGPVGTDRAAPTRSATTARSPPAAASNGATSSSATSTRRCGSSSATATTCQYITGVDTTAAARLLRTTRPSCQSGHDEYWSGGQRANVEAARDAGVNLMFLCGNEIYWQHPVGAEHRRHATARIARSSRYKDTWSNAKVDPSERGTGTWRDPAFAPPATAVKPGERPDRHRLHVERHRPGDHRLGAGGQAATVARHRAGQSQAAVRPPTLAPHTVGYESDEDLDNGFRPPGLIRLSTTTGPAPEYLQDFGTRRSRRNDHPSPDAVPRRERRPGLRCRHDPVGLGPRRTARRRRFAPGRPRMQQATINLLADMGVQPTTLMAGLVARPVRPRTRTAPTVSVTSPSAGTTVQNGTASRSAAPPQTSVASSPASRSRSTAVPRGIRRPAPTTGPIRTPRRGPVPPRSCRSGRRTTA